jgi:hypothetical protein
MDAKKTEKTIVRGFEAGDKVTVRFYDNNRKWKFGTVIKNYENYITWS